MVWRSRGQPVSSVESTMNEEIEQIEVEVRNGSINVRDTENNVHRKFASAPEGTDYDNYQEEQHRLAEEARLREKELRREKQEEETRRLAEEAARLREEELRWQEQDYETLHAEAKGLRGEHAERDRQHLTQSNEKPPKHCLTVYVGCLSEDPAPTEDDLRRFFTRPDINVASARVIKDTSKRGLKKGRGRGHGFVDFHDPKSFNQALALQSEKAVGLAASDDGKLVIQAAIKGPRSGPQ